MAHFGTSYSPWATSVSRNMKNEFWYLFFIARVRCDSGDDQASIGSGMGRPASIGSGMGRLESIGSGMGRRIEAKDCLVLEGHINTIVHDLYDMITNRL